MANKPHEFPIFTSLEPSRMQRMVGVIFKFLHNAGDLLGINDITSVLCDHRTIYEIRRI
jgi:hypothetical protein